MNWKYLSLDNMINDISKHSYIYYIDYQTIDILNEHFKCTLELNFNAYNNFIRRTFEIKDILFTLHILQK